MKDYYDRFARVLTDYSLGIKRGETVSVGAPVEAVPLVEALYERLLEKGAFPIVRLRLDNEEEVFFRHAKRRHLETLLDLDLHAARRIDAHIIIMAETNTAALSSVDPRKQALLSRTRKPLKDIILKKDRWVLTLFPTRAYAQDAEMGLDEFRDFAGRALYLDRPDPVKAWRDLDRRQKRVIRALSGADKVRIISSDTDLTLSVRGRTFVNSSGKRNMPSGEVFTGPIERSASGYIRFSFPVVHGGRVVEGVRLVFGKGRVVEASAEKNGDYLETMLDMDKGARYLGEFAFGLNSGIDRFIKNILFDEKIGGTIHLALGSSYPETGGRNRSALHWDMIKDLRDEGEVRIDGRVFMKRGKVRL